jgi:hypothetical protein
VNKEPFPILGSVQILLSHGRSTFTSAVVSNAPHISSFQCSGTVSSPVTLHGRTDRIRCDKTFLRREHRSNGNIVPVHLSACSFGGIYTCGVQIPFLTRTVIKYTCSGQHALVYFPVFAEPDSMMSLSTRS